MRVAVTAATFTVYDWPLVNGPILSGDAVPDVSTSDGDVITWYRTIVAVDVGVVNATMSAPSVAVTEVMFGAVGGSTTHAVRTQLSLSIGFVAVQEEVELAATLVAVFTQETVRVIVPVPH